jgi:hypothetical protein
VQIHEIGEHRGLPYPANLLPQEERSPSRKGAKQDQEEKENDQNDGSSLRSSFASLRLCESASFISQLTDFGLAKVGFEKEEEED